jgi:hypothetical protein
MNSPQRSSERGAAMTDYYVTFRDDVLHAIEDVDPGDIDTIVVIAADYERDVAAAREAGVREAIAAVEILVGEWEEPCGDVDAVLLALRALVGK